jgi:hypothetical protein
MAPSRPAIYPEQLGLAIICVAVIAFGAYTLIRAFT